MSEPSGTISNENESGTRLCGRVVLYTSNKKFGLNEAITEQLCVIVLIEAITEQAKA